MQRKRHRGDGGPDDDIGQWAGRPRAKGKKDVAKAVVRISSSEGIDPNDSVWFPFYAALPFPYQGELLYAVSSKDLIMVGKAE